MGHIERRGKGKYKARYRDPSGRERSRTFMRKVDADRFLAGIGTAIGEGSWTDPARARLTVGDWGRRWLDGRADLKPKTRASYESLWRTCIAPKWERVPLARVEYQAVAAWVADLSTRVSASRTRQAAGLLRHMLDDAVKDRRLPRNPAHGVDLPRVPEHVKRYLTHHQVETLAGAAGDYSTLVRLLAYSGVRWGEASALRGQDVDLMRRRLHVRRSLSDVNGRLTFEAPKTHRSRTVPLPRFLCDLLTEHMAGQSPDDLLFQNRQGGPLRSGNFRRGVWDRAVIEAGLPGLVPHDLRHTAASLAVASGASVLLVARMLGHKDAAVTLNVYADLFDQDLDSVAERLDAAFTESRAAYVRPDAASEVVALPLAETGNGL